MSELSIQIEKFEENIIAKYGKKGLNFNLCRKKQCCLMQDPKNRKKCFSAQDCLYKLPVIDGLIWG